MNIPNLVRMANQIEAFFRADPDREAAIAGVESHLRRYWEPRMRRALASEVESGGAAELGDLARLAVRRLAEAAGGGVPGAGEPPQ